MSLLDELEAVEPEYNGINLYVIEESGVECETVSNEFQGSGRWSEHWTAVFKRGDELVGMDYELPATEYQEGGDYTAEFYPVESYEVTITKYRKIK